MAPVAVVPTLFEDANQIAMHSRHIGLALPSSVWLPIMNAPIDRSLRPPCRRPVLDAAGAQVMREYYRRAAHAFTAWDESVQALVCVEAELAVRQALQAAGVVQ